MYYALKQYICLGNHLNKKVGSGGIFSLFSMKIRILSYKKNLKGNNQYILIGLIPCSRQFMSYTIFFNKHIYNFTPNPHLTKIFIAFFKLLRIFYFSDFSFPSYARAYWNMPSYATAKNDSISGPDTHLLYVFIQ